MTGEEDSRKADRLWLEQALALGALGEGAASPNPRVGAVLVREGRAVGRGYHQSPGLPHAEALAVAEAGERARGATLYVNLEPCAHHGRTPPCTELLVRSGIARVVASVQDPNPRVDGRGFAALRRKGIVVEVGLLEEASRALNEPFFHVHLQGRPLVTLKAAISLDGMLAARGGVSRWITGDAARRFAHRLRLRHDAVLVGAETVRKDNPRLTVRLPRVDATRLRAVLAPGLDIDPGAHLFADESEGYPRTRVYHGPSPDPDRVRRLKGRADLVAVSMREGALELTEVLEDLRSAGVQSLLVEGGARTFAGFVEAGLADRAALFVAARLLGARGGTPLLDRRAVVSPERGFKLEGTQQLALGEDVLFLGRLQAFEAS